MKIFALLLIILAQPAFAVEPGEMLADPRLEARARIIAADLRCLVCQNQSIDDSDADVAHDLRVLVRQRLQVGDSDDAVKQYLVARYGDYILLKPPLQANTYVLWLAPALFLLIGFGLARMIYRRKISDAKPLNAAEAKRLASLMEKKP